MTANVNAEKRPGLLARLRKDQRGNTIAIFAAAVFPLVGLIGGGLDMSRIYLVRTRLQAACDAGALAGRKQMGIGLWSANSGKANTEATRMFNLNYGPNSYGTISTPPAFSETSGTVSGSASATIPMTLMRIFGSREKTVSVTCNAAQSIPNTDIMFVLDTTGSMANAPNGQTVTTSNPSKIAGLRKVTKCFYEALAKVNIASVSPADCNEASNPSGGNVSGSQIRFGFVPYSSNVNVGKLLPNEFMVDSFGYQSREANLTPVWAYTLGTQNAAVFGAYNNPAVPTTPTSGWVSYTPSSTTSTNVNVNGTNYPSVRSPASCSGASTPGATTDPLVAYTDTLTSTSSAAPVHPGGNATTSTIPYTTYTRNQPQTRRFYRYLANSNSRCRLQYATASFDKQATGNATRNVNWTYYANTFQTWDYKRDIVFDVSSLKNSGGWNSTVPLPVGYSTQNLLVSGSTTSTQYKRVVNSNVTWDGCIEERQTKRLNSWNPWPEDSPDLDMRTPPTSDDTTRWKPSLASGIWLRYDSSGNKYYPDILNDSTNRSTNSSYACPSAARLLAEYNGSTGATSFEGYVDGLVAVGSTYHDIGMLWGGRLILEDGIFAANNQSGTANGIDRNIIFMTDGDTDSGETANTAYGRAWWDRRQEVNTNYSPSETDVDTKINARFPAICDQLTGVENITVWVVSFGGTGISNTTKTRLQQCATDNDHYFDAADTAGLLTSFKAIASAISQLRLTN